ncbi:hypothetical protein [Thalassococcus sp. S3]|uniref:hypothetical protein n=1 Tax=Thalassococcus sp. S3 TaxID=2017482 RepID=UPI0010245801|nr:hypothetical protein [Thalassococcus sp. S3]QBF31375.1 hypothetical protein CFI11_09100 [Thalassococcus sp. S3]
MTTHVAEIVTFRLEPGTDPQAFAAAAKGTEAALRKMGTLISRTLSCDEDGLWTDHIVWAFMEDAKAAAQAVMQEPSFQPFGKMISSQDLVMRHAYIHLQMD